MLERASHVVGCVTIARSGDGRFSMQFSFGGNNEDRAPFKGRATYDTCVAIHIMVCIVVLIRKCNLIKITN